MYESSWFDRSLLLEPFGPLQNCQVSRFEDQVDYLPIPLPASSARSMGKDVFQMLEEISSHKNRAANHKQGTVITPRRHRPGAITTLRDVLQPVKNGLICGNSKPPYVPVIAHIFNSAGHEQNNLAKRSLCVDKRQVNDCLEDDLARLKIRFTI